MSVGFIRRWRAPRKLINNIFLEIFYPTTVKTSELDNFMWRGDFFAENEGGRIMVNGQRD